MNQKSIIRLAKRAEPVVGKLGAKREILKPGEIAEALGVHKSTLRNWSRRGNFPTPRVLPGTKRIIGYEASEYLDWRERTIALGKTKSK